MARVKSPSAEVLIEAVRRQAASLNSYRDGELESIMTAGRVYDRVSGNFKAVGWRVVLAYRDEEDVYNEIEVLVADEDIPRMEQTVLDDVRFVG